MQHLLKSENAAVGAIMDSSLSFITADFASFDEDGFEMQHPCTELIPASLTPLRAPLVSRAPSFAMLSQQAASSTRAQTQIDVAMDAVAESSIRTYLETLTEGFWTRHRASTDGRRSAEWCEQAFADMGLAAELQEFGNGDLFPNVIATLHGSASQ